MSFRACAKSRDLLMMPQMSYCSRFRRRRFTVLDCKPWAFNCSYGQFQQRLLLRMRSNGYLWTSGVNLDTAVRFLIGLGLECEISAIWRRFHLFLHLICWKSAIFLPPVCQTHWPTKYSTGIDSTPTAINSTKFEVDTTIHCRVIAFLLLIHYVTLWPWHLTFWPSTVVIHGGSRDQHYHLVRRPCAYSFRELWVIMSSLKMHMPPLSMRRITWSVSTDLKIISFRIPDPDLPIHYTTFLGLRRRLRVVYFRAVQG